MVGPKLFLALTLTLSLTACSYTRHIGTVGSKRFTKVQLGSLTAPGQTLLVVEDTSTHEITLMTPMAGNGVVPGLLQAGGIVGGAIALGNIVDSDSDSSSTTINIADDPPAPPMGVPPKPQRPPKNRPPSNRPPHKGWK